MFTEATPKYPVAVFELIPESKRGAGFVREDTIGTETPIHLIHPKNRVVQNESVKRVKQKIEGKEVFVNVRTRYIYGQTITLKEDQEAKKNPNQ